MTWNATLCTTQPSRPLKRCPTLGGNAWSRRLSPARSCWPGSRPIWTIVCAMPSGWSALTDRRLLALDVAGRGDQPDCGAVAAPSGLDAAAQRAGRRRHARTVRRRRPPGGLALHAGPQHPAHRLVRRFDVIGRSRSATGTGETTDDLPRLRRAAHARAIRVCRLRAAPVVPTVSSLVRLCAFARRTPEWSLLGFVLSLASTAAGLVPPYLTMPLIERRADSAPERRAGRFRRWSPGIWRAWLAPPLLAWLLGWGRT